jgi:hypothetical protein
MSDPFELIVAPSSRSEWQEAGRFDLGGFQRWLEQAVTTQSYVLEAWQAVLWGDEVATATLAGYYGA